MPRRLPRMTAVESAVRESLRRHGLEGASLVTAVSSGADSTALLHALYSHRIAMGLTLHVAHFDHNFRPEAAEDASFVAEMAAGLGLPCIMEHADPMAYQREQGISSFEAAARELRYRFLGRAADSVGAAVVVLGHNADDQAETVLMHLIRGSGIDGLRGMDVLTTWRSSDGQQHVNLFRPLLTLTKEQLRDYCHHGGIAYREDPANWDMRFTRNRVRHQLLPSLQDYNPRISEALVRLAQAASQETDFLESEVERAWEQLAHKEGDAVTLDRAALSRRPLALQARLLRRAYREMMGGGRRLQMSHVDAMIALVEGRPGGQIVLPLGLRLTSTNETLTMRRDVGVQLAPLPFEGEHRLRVPILGAGTVVTDLSGWQVTVEWTDATSGVPVDPLAAVLDLGDNEPELWVRRRRRGDRFQPYGLSNEKKLQDFLVDLKVPSSRRDSIPLVLSNGRIAWVVGHRVAHWAAVSPASRSVLRVRFNPLHDS